jgi:Ca2+-binding EF-hand superfamily protein
MGSDIQKIKAYNLFQAFDVENNGYLEKADLDALAGRLAAGQGRPPGSPLHRELQSKLEAYWNELIKSLDSNLDGRVAREEFLQFSAKLMKNPTGPASQSLHEVSEVIFTMADHDGSGSISEREFGQCMRAYGVAEAAAARAFRLIDCDGDSRITREEWRTFLRDVFQSRALNDASAMVFGPGSRGRA